MAVIGLDVGTTGCKCTIFSSEGKQCAYSYMEYRMVNPGHGQYELNPSEVWAAVKNVISSAVAKYKKPSDRNCEEITAICVSSFGEAGMPIDAYGNILYNSILYMDSRGASQCETLAGKIDNTKVMSLTGHRIHPMYTLAKLMWFKENRPDIYARTWKYMLFEDFILYRLGNKPYIDYSLAARTMAFNITEKKWANTILDAAGVRPDIFSEAVPSGTIVGTLSGEVADEIGLSSNVRLVTGGHDQVCAALGGGVHAGGDAIYGIGSVECITPAFNGPRLGKTMLDNNFSCVPYVIDGMYVTYAFNITGGSLLKWYRDNFAPSVIAEAISSGRSVYALLDERAASEPSNILVLPHFAGAGTPYMDVNAQGAIFGLTFDKGAGHVYRAMLEGTTYEMLYNLELLESSGIYISELRAAGGGARSDLWLQIKADIMGKKVVALDIDEAGTLGAAILAGSATGIFGSVSEAVKLMVKPRKEYYPDPRNSAIYRDMYEKYKKMYDAVKSVMAN